MPSKSRGGLSKREFAAKNQAATKPAAKAPSSKDRGGLSAREFAAKNAGGVLDYKTGSISVPKKVTYSPKSGKAIVTSEPEGGYDYSEAKSTPKMYSPAIPEGFKQQMSAVKNYSEAKSSPINYSPAKREEVSRSKSNENQEGFLSKAKKTVRELGDAIVNPKTSLGKFSEEEVNKYDESKRPGIKIVDGKVVSTGPGFKQSVKESFSKNALKGKLRGIASVLSGFASLPSYGVQYLETKFGGEEGKKRAEALEKNRREGLGKLEDFGKGAENIEQASAGRFAERILNIPAGITKSSAVIAEKSLSKASKNAVSREIVASGTKAAKGARESMSIPTARAASFADEGADSARIASKADDVPDNVRLSSRRGEAPLKDEPFQAPEKAPIERTKVAKLKESETALRAKIAKSIDDANKAPDVIDETTGKLKPKKDPTAEIEGHINEFRKEFEDLTGEKAPADPDEMLARLKSIERENEGAWRKQDKRWTREKDLRSMAGVRQGKTYTRGSRGVSGGKTSSKGGVRKGILLEARRRTLAIRENAPANKEARKYKSAEEFVKAHTPAFRASDKPFNPKLIGDKAGLFTAPSENLAGFYSERGKRPVEQLFISPNVKVLEWKDIPESLKNFDGKDIENQQMLIKNYAKEKGYDVVGYEPTADYKYGIENQIVNPDVVKTKSQLTDLWKKAHQSKNVPKKPYTQEIQGLVDTKSVFDAGEMGYGEAKVFSRRWNQAVESGAINAEKVSEPVRPVFGKNGQKIGSDSFGNGGNVPRGTETKLPPMPKKGPIRQWINEVGTRTREVIQDNWIRVKKLQERPDVVIDGTKLTPYEAETLFHGRVGTRITEANDALKTIDKEIADLEKVMKSTAVRKDIDRYLVAKHAPERNAIHGEGAAGMTNAEADEIVKAFEGDSKNKAAIAVAEKIKTLNDKTLDLLRDSQVIDEEMYQKLRTAYKNHVPLNRIFDETDDVGSALVGRGYDVRGSGIKRAKGSQREVDDILSNVGANLEQAIVRAEKNRVNLSVLEFARDNKNTGLFTEIKPKAIGQSFDGRPLLERVDDPLVLTVRENGKPVYLRINDERLATAFKGIGTEKLPPLLNFVGGFTRLYSGLATRFNPEFVFSNKLRDLQEMAAYMAAQKNVGFSGAAKTALRDPISMKDVTDFMRGADTPGAKLYKQMMEDGGTTGGMALSTRKQFKIDVESMRQMNRGGVLNLKKNGKKIVETFDNWNQIFEDSTRLSVYKTALERGLSRDRAAFLAKNATINFNKKGTGGAILNSMYMFSNASIQGTTKLLTAMKDPKVASAVVGSVGTAVWAANSWNDKVDPDWRDKVSKFDRNSNLVVVLPSDSGVKYITIPVSWGLKPIKVMADYSYDASNGKASDKSGYQIAGDVLSSIWDGYNPIGGSDVTSALVPTPLDIPVEISRNKKWSGSVIHPDSKEGVPESENFFKNKEGVPSDKSFQFDVLRKGTAGIAKATNGNIQINPANLKYALDGYLSGLGRFGTGMFETGKAFSEKGLPQASDAPFVRRFYKNKTEEEIAKAQKFDAKDELYNKLNSVPKEEQAPIIQEYLNSLPADQRKGAAYGLFQDGFSTKGTTSSDDLIRMRPLVDKINKLEDEGKYDEVDQIIEGLSPEDLKSFKNAAKSIKSKASKDLTAQLKPKLDPVVDQILELENSGKYDESDQLFYSLSEDEQKVVKKLIKQR